MHGVYSTIDCALWGNTDSGSQNQRDQSASKCVTFFSSEKRCHAISAFKQKRAFHILRSHNFALHHFWRIMLAKTILLFLRGFANQREGRPLTGFGLNRYNIKRKHHEKNTFCMFVRDFGSRL